MRRVAAGPWCLRVSSRAMRTACPLSRSTQRAVARPRPGRAPGGPRTPAVRREPLLGLGQGARQVDDTREPRRAVWPRVDAKMETSLVQDRHADQLVPEPELGLEVIGFLGAGDDHGDLGHRATLCGW